MASADFSTTTECEGLLTEWIQAYFTELKELDDEFVNNLDLGIYFDRREGVPERISNQHGDLKSLLDNVDVTEGWRILMSMTSQIKNIFRRRKSDVLCEAINRGHKNIAETIIEYLTPDQLLQYLQLEDERGNKYLYSSYLYRQSSLLAKLLYRLPEVSQRYEVLNIRDRSGNTVLHSSATTELLQSLESEDLCYKLLTTQNNEGQTPLYVLWPSHIKAALDSVTADQRLTLIDMRDNKGQTAAEYRAREISEDQDQGLRSIFFRKECLAVIEYSRCEARIEIVISTQHESVRDDMLRRIIQEESLTQDEIQKLSPLTSQYIIPRQRRQERLDERLDEPDFRFILGEHLATINSQREKQTSRYSLIFYNTEQRENGAEAEASNLEKALSHTGCDVIKAKWSHTDELRQMISDRLSDIGGRCNFLFVCIMSHGELGQLRGSDDSLVSISTIIRDFEQNLPAHVPLVLMIQACQNSEVGALSATTADMPAVHTSSNSTDDKHVVLTRDNTVLLLASKPGGVAYRGVYTGELADQIRQSNGNISLHDMHSEAVIGLRRNYGSEQTPVYSDTLDKRLLMPGKA